MSSLICSAGADNFEFERKIAVKYEERNTHTTTAQGSQS